MKEKLKNAFLVLLFVSLVAYLSITSILNLTNKKDLRTVNLAEAFDILEVKHSINGLIPLGTDHYYVGIEMEDESFNAYIIKASKDWLDTHFDSGNMAKDAGGFEFTTLAYKVTDYKVTRELSSRAAQIRGVNYPLGTEYCLDINYKMMAALRLLVAVLCVILAVTGIYVVRNKGTINPIFGKCWGVGILITAVLLLLCLI